MRPPARRATPAFPFAAEYRYAGFMFAARTSSLLLILATFSGIVGINQDAAARSAAPQDQADPRVLQVDREKREVRVLCLQVSSTTILVIIKLFSRLPPELVPERVRIFPFRSEEAVDQ